MTKTKRTILFSILAILFLIIAPIVLFYSEGYRFDTETNKIIKTGGIFIKIFPGESDILIDNKIEEKTSNFSRSVLIQNLLPKEHNVKISKSGYFSWEKELEIKEKEVTEVEIILFPKNIIQETIIEELENVFKTNENFIIEKQDGLYYFNPKENIEEFIHNLEFENIEIINNLPLIEYQNKYYLGKTPFSNMGQTNFNIDSRNNVFYMINDGLYKNNKLIEINIGTYNINEDAVYFLKNGFLYKNDAKLTDEIFELDPQKTYNLIIIQDKIFLNENNETLYLLDENLFKKILELNNNLEYSLIENKILFNTGNEIWVYFIEDNFYPNFIPKNTLKFLTRFSNSIDNLAWINNEYYIFAKENKLYVSEFDFRDTINYYPMINNLNNANVYFDKQSKQLYLFNNNQIIQTEKIIP